MSNKKSGSTPHQRKEFLEDCGFTRARHGDGSHEVWEHKRLKELMQSGAKVAVESLPTNIDARMAWHMTVCDNPGTGLWRNMMKQASACKAACEKFEAKSINELQRLELTSEFRRAAQAYKDWKKNVDHAVRAGTKIPAAPISYKALQQMKDKLPSPAK